MMNKNIRSIIFLIVLIGLFISSSHGQIKSFGIKIGYNYSKLNYNPEMKELDYRYKFGIKLGIFIEYKFSDMFSVNSELNYSIRGGEYAPNFLLHETTEKYIQKLEYLEIPILFEYYLDFSNNAIKPKIFIGPEVSYLLDATNEYKNKSFSKDINEKEKFESFEYGIVLGIGMDFNILKNKLTFDTRYNLGMNNISKKANTDIKNKVWSINLGYVFSIN